MPYFRFWAEQIIEADSEEEAETIFNDDCTGFAAECEKWPRSRLEPDYELYNLVSQNAQAVAEEELSRKLTEEELAVVEHKLEDYIDWSEAMALCIQHEL